MTLPTWSDAAIPLPVADWTARAVRAPVTRWTETSPAMPVTEWGILTRFLPQMWLSAPLLPTSQTCYGATVTVTIEASLFNNSAAFFDAQTTQFVAPALLTNSQSFFTPSVAMPLFPSLVTNAQTFFGPTTTQYVAAGLVTNSQTFHAPSTTQYLAPALLTNSQSFYAPTVSPPPTVKTYITGASSSGYTTSYTFSSTSIGTASSDRLVVVVVEGRQAVVDRTVSSVTIGGVSATIVSATNVSGRYPGCIAYLTVTSGTTADIVVTFSGSTGSGCAIQVYTLTSLSSTTPVDSDQSGTVASPASVTLTTSSQGALIAGVGGNGGATGSISWTGPTEDYEVSPATGFRVGSASKDNTGTSETVTATETVATQMRLMAVAWR